MDIFLDLAKQRCESLPWSSCHLSSPFNQELQKSIIDVEVFQCPIQENAMAEVVDTFLLALFLWVVFWGVARRRYRKAKTYSKEYQRLMNTNTWITFATHLKYGKTCYRCYRRSTYRSPLTVHHVDYLATRDGRMLMPWDKEYLRHNLLRVVCWKCHKRERPARWLSLT